MKNYSLIVALALILAASTAIAQAQSPTGRQSAPLQQNIPAPAPAPTVPDTAQIRVAVPDTIAQPNSVFVVQDTLQFGGLLHLVVDYLDAQNSVPIVTADGQWLAPVETFTVAAWNEKYSGIGIELPDSVADSGSRFVSTFRIYRRDPLQIAWENYLSDVLFVRGQTDGMEQTATIRRPRSLAWTPWRLIIALVIVLIIAYLIYRWWRRRRRPPPLVHWRPADPAWIAFAVGLQELIQDNVLARGESRLFLDRLASLTRDYAAGRYRIAAREMTGAEIISACQKLGHELSHPRGFAGLIKMADRERYHPEPPSIPHCREQAVKVFGQVEEVRLDGRYHNLAPATQLAGAQAWADLVRELGRPDRSANSKPAAQEVR